MMRQHQSVTDDVLNRCRQLGFALVGVAEVVPTRWRDELLAWLEQGRQGEMSYLARHVDLRLDPAAMMPGARAIICVADRYHTVGRDRREVGPPRGRIARYARGNDYHKEMKRRLHALCDVLQEHFPQEQFRACVDTAPILEREYAQRAGLGAVGKNTLLIQQGVGSYLLLGEVITTLAIEPTPELGETDPCGSCTRCIDACPTDAITPWSVDATKCISYLTIEHRSEIDPAFHEPIGDWLFGCDICQEVCPHNQPTRSKKHLDSNPAYQPRRQSFDLLSVLQWTEDDRREAFMRSSLKRARLAMIKRNALIVAGNALAKRDDPELRKRIAQIAADTTEDDLVRNTARQVQARLGVG